MAAPVNWALQESGAHVAEVSHEAAHVASSAANLLQPAEDALWITGDAPQHVTLALSPFHPPLHYAGWHVWHDYLTNPRMVEVASGPSLDAMSAVLVCQALPGAGTQVWKLPHAIPSEHRYARFRIVDTFGPGPTYMNNIVLLEQDPGPNYNAHTSREEPSSTADDFIHTNSPDRPTVATLNSAAGSSGLGLRGGNAAATAAAAAPYMLSPASATRALSGVFVGSGLERSPLPRQMPPSSFLSGTNTSTPAGRASDVGVFVLPAGSASAHRDEAGRSPGGARSSSRMSQLLRDLDDDIRLLKPIKSVSSAKNMLVYVPEEPRAATPAPPNGDDEESDEEDADERDAARRRQKRRSHHHRRSRDRNGRTHHNGTSAAAAGGPAAPAAGLALGASPVSLTIWPQPTSLPPGPELGGSVNEARLGALEQAVAALNEAVQHQRDDLAMIKRVLLQQATERRKEAEQRYEEKQRTAAATAAAAVALAAPPPPPAAHIAAPPSPPPPQPPLPLTHRSITVGFPEEALRAYVESVLDHKLHKHMKKIEARLLQRLDKQLHDVIKVLSVTVEGRLAAVPSSPTRSPVAERSFRPSSAGPAAAATGQSAIRGMPGGAVDRAGPSINLSEVGSSPSSSKGHYYHTPVSRTDSGGRALPSSAVAAAGVAAEQPTSYVHLRHSPHTYRSAAAVPSVSLSKSTPL